MKNIWSKIWTWIKSLFITWYNNPVLKVEEVKNYIDTIDTNEDGCLSIKEIVDKLKEEVKKVF